MLFRTLHSNIKASIANQHEYLGKNVSDHHTDDFKLYVCTDWSDDSSCFSCGYFPSVLAFGWATMSCNAQGKTVKIVAKSGYRLDICEIHIYGYGKFSTVLLVVFLQC